LEAPLPGGAIRCISGGRPVARSGAPRQRDGKHARREACGARAGAGVSGRRNLVFVALPRALDAKLKAAGASYYVRPSETLRLPADHVLARLVTSFLTREDDIGRFVA